MRKGPLIVFFISLIACVPDSDEYFTPLGADSIDFARSFSRVQTWRSTLNDTITNLALSQGTSVVKGEQRFTSNTQFYFDSLYLRVDATTSANPSDIFGTKNDLVRIRFRRNANGNDLLDCYVALFPEFSDTTINGGSSTWQTDTFEWNDRQYFKPLILSGNLSDFEAVCDSTGNMLAFKTTNNIIYEPVN